MFSILLADELAEQHMDQQAARRSQEHGCGEVALQDSAARTDGAIPDRSLIVEFKIARSPGIQFPLGPA